MAETVPKSLMYFRLSWKALLQGDLKEWDRLCNLAIQAIEEENRLLIFKPTDPLEKN